MFTITYDNNGTIRGWQDYDRIIVRRTGAVFSAEIKEDVVLKNECFRHHKIPVSDVVKVTSEGMTSVVDYGDGTCDKLYTITVNGETTEHEFDYYKTAPY